MSDVRTLFYRDGGFYFSSKGGVCMMGMNDVLRGESKCLKYNLEI